MAARMACGGFRLPVLVLLFLTGFRCEKILSQAKRCGDPGCESLMIRAQASRDYRGPDCRYLNFKFGEEILVYYKLSGTRDDLWQGSQGKKSGYFPKDAVNIEEVYISKEVEVPAKETDFICLDGGEYIFENEDSILHQKDTELDYLNPDTEPYLTVPEGEILKPTRISSDVEKGMNPIAEQNEQDITVERIPSVLVPPKNDEQEPSDKPEIGESTKRDVLPEPVKDSWTVSGFAGWLGMGGKGEENVLTPMSEPLQENTFNSRRIALSDEIILQKEDEEELETSTSSWFPSGFREFLPFGREETEQVLEEKDKASVAQTQDNTLVEDSEENTVSIETEALKEDQDENESGDVDSKSKWFNLGLHNMFSFGNIAKGTLNVKEEQTNEDSDQIDVGESKQIMNTLKAGTSADHESNLKIDGSERQEMLNDRARTDLNDYLDSNQNIAFMETSLSEEYQDTKGQGDISSNSWFNLGLDDILSFRESSKDSTMLKEELIEEAVNMTEMEGETQAVNPRETDSVLDTEETDIMGRQVTEDIGDLETPNNLKEAETTPLTSAWYSNHLENILNLKMHTTTDEPRLAADEHSKEQVTGLYSTESSVDSILTEHADVEKISKEARSRKQGQVPGVAIQTTTFERNTLLKEESDQKTEQSEQLNNPLSGDGGESIYDPTVLLLANTAAPRQLGEQVKNNNADVENKHVRDLQTETHAISSVHAQEENESTFGIMEHLKPQDILSHVSFIWSTLVAGSDKAVALLPEDLRPGPDLYGFSWEMAICAVLVGVFTVTVFLCQASKAIGSRRYIGRERELASKVAELVENKCKELEKLSIYQKEYEELELSITDANLLKESSETTCLEATCEKLNQSNSALSEEILTLEKELEEEKSKRSQQDGFIDEIQRRVESLEKEAMSMKSHADEARTTLKVFQINKGRLEMALRDAKEEHVHFQESNEQLLREAEGWGERFNELTEQTKMFESSKQDMEEALNNKECQVKSLTDCLLTMKDWSAELSKENNLHDNNWEAEVTVETENGEHLDDHQKRTVKKLIFAAKLNASLKTLETERNQLYDKLSDEVKAKEELAERIDHLQKEQNSLNSENSQFEFAVQKLQQKLKVMTEMYQENELKLHRKLTVEEKHRLQKEEKLSKVDEKIYHAAEELHNYRTRAKDLEEELEKTIRSYQSQISSHEKKGHDNWLTARAAERQLNDIKKENAHNRQKLTELEFKLEQMEKDPYALDVPRGFGRENSPYGPSPLGRPSPETRAFLSPPTLLEGPLRISPMLPGGERGSRSPGDNAGYSNTSERTETGSDRVSDHQGANSDHGSLSPPWERDRRLNVQASGPGQHYPDPSFHPRRQEKYFHNPPISGRFSGPADLQRGYNMHSFEKTDGQLSAENSSLNETNRNGANENHGNVINVADHSLQPENEAVGPCFVPPPQLMRGPLLPMDPRGPFLRRVSPFPPRIMDMYGPRDYFSVPNYSGLPRHPIGMRHPFPSQPFLHFPPLQRPGFLPPPPPPENRTEQSTGLTYAPKASDAENPNPHQET